MLTGRWICALGWTLLVYVITSYKALSVFVLLM